MNWEDLLYDKSKYKFPKLAIRVLIFSPLVPINEPRFSDPKKRTNKYLFQIIQGLKIYVFTHLYNRHLLFYPLKGVWVLLLALCQQELELWIRLKIRVFTPDIVNHNSKWWSFKRAMIIDWLLFFPQQKPDQRLR